MSTDMIVKDLPRICTEPLVKPIILLPSAESARRNDIIVGLCATSFFYTGQSVRAKNDADFAKDGYARIVGVCSNYKAFLGTQDEKDVDWPENDNPMIVAARYEKSGQVVNATTNYFRPL